MVGPQVELGPGCEVGPFCHVQGRVRIGAGTRLISGVTIGSLPTDRRYGGEDTEVTIGRDNLFFEYSTVHRAVGAGQVTAIGDGNMVMAYVHIAHNCRVGSRCVITNGVQLAGHVAVNDDANIGGLTGVHQFCRVGQLAMVGACSYVNKDIPPFMLAAGNPCRVRGLNTLGLRRAGIATETITAIRHAFRLIYRSGLNLSQALSTIEEELTTGPDRTEVRMLVDFCRESARGVALRAEMVRNMRGD